MNGVLWRAFEALNDALMEQLDALADAAIAGTVHGDASEAEERNGPWAIGG